MIDNKNFFFFPTLENICSEMEAKHQKSSCKYPYAAAVFIKYLKKKKKSILIKILLVFQGEF